MKPKFGIGDRVVYFHSKDIIGTVKNIKYGSECVDGYRVQWDDGWIGWYYHFNLILYQKFVYDNDFMERIKDRIK